MKTAAALEFAFGVVVTIAGVKNSQLASVVNSAATMANAKAQLNARMSSIALMA